MTQQGHAGAVPLLERAAELSLIEQTIESAASGAGSALVLRGPAGIGKTRLVDAAIDCGRERGLRTSSARPGPLERALPWGVARTLLLPALGHAPEATGALARDVLSTEGAGLHGEDPQSAAVFALQELAEALAAQRPLLLVVDDLHWADVASTRWLDHLAGRLRALPIALIAALRTGERLDAAPTIDELLGRDGLRLHTPQPLSESAALELASTIFGSDATPALARECLAATGGNPLLLRGLLDELRTAGRDLSPGTIHEVTPASVQEEIGRRLAREEPTVRRVAVAVAILGDGARIDEVAALANLDTPRTAEAADRLVAHEILVSDGALGFVHPLVEAAVLATLPEHRRGAEHARAARVLERAGAALERVATQVLAAPPSADPWNVSALRAAAHSALARGAPESAATYLERALIEPPDASSRGDVLHLLGRVELGARPDRAVVHLRTALDLTAEPSVRARIVVDLASALMQGLDFEQADAVLAEVAAALGDADRETTLRLEALRVGIGLQSPAFSHAGAARLRELEPAVSTGRTPGERLVLAQLVLTTPLGIETAETTAQMARTAIATGALLDEVTSDSHVYWYALSGLLFAEQFDECSQLVASAVVDARRRGSRLGLSLTSWFAGAIAYRTGRLDRAVGQAAAAIDLAGGSTPAALLAAQLLAMAEIDRGRADTALALLDQLLTGPASPPMFTTALLTHARGLVHHALGHQQAAVADIEASTPVLDELDVDPWLLPWRSEAALVLAATGRDRRARAMAAHELELTRRWGSPRALGLALRASALAQRPVDLHGLEQAVVVLAGSADRAAYARALLDLGRVLRRARRGVAADDVLRQALVESIASGASGIGHEVRAELAQASAAPGRVEREDERLTAGEWRVAELAAQRLTNREIADALFITVRTVETHLTHTYAKLGVRGRRELAAALGSALAPTAEPAAPIEPQTQPA